MGLCLAVAKDSRIKKKIPEIPEEVQIEILSRLPAKSLMRFKCVSKHFLSLISSQYFSNIFLQHSSSRPQRFFVFVPEGRRNCSLLTSTSSHNDHSVSVLDQDLTTPELGGEFMNSTRGLVCFKYGSRARICNPNTKQVVELPEMVWCTRDWYYLGHEMVRTITQWYCLGYDPVHDEYKVLSQACELSKYSRVVKSEHQVLVLGPGASWRAIKSHTFPHEARGGRISINGILYYCARTDESKDVIMSFDLNSEKFNIIELSKEYTTGLMNYKGKLALLNHSNYGRLKLWVLEDAKKSQWSNAKTFVLPFCEMDYVHAKCHYLNNYTSHSCKILLTKDYTQQSPLFFIYDLERNEITQSIHILDSFTVGNWMTSVCWIDIENIMYLET